MTGALPADPDVVVVGAGAAGLGAAHRLRRRGLTALVVEAAARAGGRAHTDTARFGVPVDLGCSWMSGADGNALVKVARRAGFTLEDHTDAPQNLFAGGRRATARERAQYEAAHEAMERALEAAGRAGHSGPASEVVPRKMPFMGAAMSWRGPMDHGVDFDELSPAAHWSQADDQPSYLVREGYGAVVETLAQDLPIALDAPVTEIDWSGAGVSVETARGRVRARVCLVTVSTGVLASGAIRFVPDLPLRTQEAIHDVPMGLLTKVPLLFDGTRLGLDESAWVTYDVPPDMAARACYFIAWPCGHDYLFGNIGGRLGWDLARAGPRATVDFALEELVKLVGTAARKRFVRGFATEWASDPLTRGAYAVERMGRRGARKRLGRPVGDRVFFAGEALAGARCALANGAYDSGRKAAKRIAKALA